MFYTASFFRFRPGGAVEDEAEDGLGDMMDGGSGIGGFRKEPGHMRRSMISFGHDVSTEVGWLVLH